MENANLSLEQGDLVLGTVDRIAGTIVFVKFQDPEDPKKELEGSIIFSEVSPGRIRNIRDYVVPKKKIVCKILRISPNGNIDLSFRRVTKKEKEEVVNHFKQESSYRNILKGLLGGKDFEKIIETAKEKSGLYNFIEEVKNSEEEKAKLEKIIGKENIQKIFEVINKQKTKASIIKKEVLLTSKAEDGIEKIKAMLSLDKKQGIEIKYLSAGHYSLKTTSTELKKADNKLKEFIKELERQAKKEGMEFLEIEKKK